MIDFVYRDGDGQIVIIEGETQTTLATQEGDTQWHVQLAAYLENGGLISSTPPPAPAMSSAQLAAYKSGVKAGIDITAETQRLKYITGGAGQALTYQQKLNEIEKLGSDNSPVEANYPMLAADIGVNAKTLSEAAALVSGAYGQWLVIGSEIEKARLKAKFDVDAAKNAAAVDAVIAAITWP